MSDFDEALSSNGIFYRKYGNDVNEDPPLVLIMGYGGCMFTWPQPFVQKLVQFSPVLLFDHRGTGRSQDLPDCELRMKDLALDLKDLVSSLAYKKVNLFGFSMGGCVALEFARLFPENVGKVILQSTSAGGKFYTGADETVKERMANPRGSNFDEMLFDFFELCMSAKAMESHLRVLKGICENARPYPTSLRVLMMQAEAFRNFDASNFLPELDSEILLFHGENDRILKVPNGRRLAENLRDCRAVFIDDCEHCPHIEHEEVVVSELKQFIK